MASKSEKICDISDREKIRNLSATALISDSMCDVMASDPVQYPEEGILGD